MADLILACCLSVIGARTVNMLVRKLEEIRLSLWIEEEMQNRFGSKRGLRKKFSPATRASFTWETVSTGLPGGRILFGRSLDTFTADDADKAALLAGIAKSPRYYAPNAKDTSRVLRRRNQTLALMAANGFISPDSANSAQQRPIQVIARRKDKMLQAPAVLGTILQELKGRNADLSVEDLLQGRIRVYSTVDLRMQQIVNEALEHGLELYEQTTPERQRADPGFGRRAKEPRREHPRRDRRSSVLPRPLRRVQRL